MLIPIRIRISEEMSVFPHKHEIHAPSIDSDGSEFHVLSCGNLLQAVQYIAVQFENIPVTVASYLNDMVGKPVDFLHFDFAGANAGYHCPSTARSEVNCKIILVHFQIISFNLQNYRLVVNLSLLILAHRLRILAFPTHS